LQIEYAHPDLQAVEDVAANFRILKGRHGAASSSGATGFIGGEAFRLERMALSVPISTAPKGERVAGTAQFRNFKGLGWWRVWGSKIARESYLQKAEPGFNFLNDSSGEGCPGALISKEVRALVILEAVAEFGGSFAFQGFARN
jgi:hypothetical protein